MLSLKGRPSRDRPAYPTPDRLSLMGIAMVRREEHQVAGARTVAITEEDEAELAALEVAEAELGALKVGEDYLFLASAIALGGRCVIEPVAGYDYHIREGSISRVP